MSGLLDDPPVADAQPPPPRASRSVGMWRVELEPRAATWSTGMFEVFGLDPAGPVPDPGRWAALLHLEDQPRFRDAFDRAIGGERTVAVQFLGVMPDGRVRRLVSSMEPEAGDDGATRAVIGCLHDLTDHVVADDAIRRSEDRLRRTVEGIDAIVVYRELGDQPLLFSDQMERILGYEPEAFDSFDDWNAIVHPDDLARCRQVWDADTRTWAMKYRVRRADGAWIWIRDRGRRTPPSGSRPGGLFSIITDVTEITELGERARRLDRLEATGALAAGLAHHLNNILAGVTGFMELAHDQSSRQDVRTDLAAALAAAGRAATLVRQFREFAGRERVVPEVIDLVAFADSFVPTAEALVGLPVRVTASHDDAPVRVLFDPRLLGQILANLAVNAADAMPSGGDLTIWIGPVERTSSTTFDGLELPAGRYARIEVSDTGLGMDPATLERVFEPFFSTKDPAVGVGMSLAAAFGLVRQAGGTMAAESTPGRGTTVTIDLPMSGSDVRQASRPSDDATPSDLPRLGERAALLGQEITRAGAESA